jgi:hypothetical protein
VTCARLAPEFAPLSLYEAAILERTRAWESGRCGFRQIGAYAKRHSQSAGRVLRFQGTRKKSATSAIIVHFPQQVRDQIKILAIQKVTTLHGVVAEAFNDLFAKHGKVEIAPHEREKQFFDVL